MADIYKIDSKKKCYILHDNLLLVNVPFSKVTACVQALNAGRTDGRSLWAKPVFNLNVNFKMENDPISERMTLMQDGVAYVETAAEVADIHIWLGRNLKRRNFFPASVPVSDTKKLTHGATAAVLVALIACALFVTQNMGFLQKLENLNIIKMVEPFLTTGNIVIATLGIIAVILIGSFAAFVKSKTFLEVYEYGYRPANSRR